MQLMTHIEEREKDEELNEALNKTHYFIKVYAKLDFVSLDDVKWAFGVLQTNAIGLPMGRALYPLVSIMSHSCVPNLTAIVTPGEAIAFKVGGKHC